MNKKDNSANIVLDALKNNPELLKAVQAHLDNLDNIRTKQQLILGNLEALEMAHGAGLSWGAVMEAFQRETGCTWGSVPTFRVAVHRARCLAKKAEYEAAMARLTEMEESQWNSKSA